MKVSQMEKVVPLAPKKKPKERVWKKAKDIAEYFGVSVATIPNGLIQIMIHYLPEELEVFCNTILN